MVDIQILTKILNQTYQVNPNDIINGEISIECFFEKQKEEQEKIIKKIKTIEIKCISTYQESTYSKLLGKNTWKTRKKILKKSIVAKNKEIKLNEVKIFTFQFRLPTTWSPKAGQSYYRDWHIALSILTRVGKLYENYIVLPVKDSQRPASYTIEKPFIAPTPTQQVIIQNIQTSQVGKNTQNESDTQNEPDLKFCSYCGKQIKQDVLYCQHCGAQQ